MFINVCMAMEAIFEGEGMCRIYNVKFTFSTKPTRSIIKF